MKSIIPLLIILMFPFTGINHNGKEQYTELKNAGDQRFIKFTVKGNGKSPHYIRPLTLSLTNLKNEAINIHVSNGLQFIAKDSAYQNFIVTREEIIALKPGEQKDVDLFAMCTEATDHAPDQNAFYTVKKDMDQKLKQVAALIEKYKSFETTGQSAIWAISNNYPIENISGFDTAQASRLQKLVSRLTGRPMPPPPGKDDYKRNYYCSHVFIDKIGGKFEYKLSREMEIRIAMFDKNGMIVRELYSNSTEQPGYHQFNFEFDASVYHDKYYFIKLLVDGNVKVSHKISLD